jgi:hypothetical protein
VVDGRDCRWLGLSRRSSGVRVPSLPFSKPPLRRFIRDRTAPPLPATPSDNSAAVLAAVKRPPSSGEHPPRTRSQRAITTQGGTTMTRLHLTPRRISCAFPTALILSAVALAVATAAQAAPSAPAAAGPHEVQRQVIQRYKVPQENPNSDAQEKGIWFDNSLIPSTPTGTDLAAEALRAATTRGISAGPGVNSGASSAPTRARRPPRMASANGAMIGVVFGSVAWPL